MTVVFCSTVYFYFPSSSSASAAVVVMPPLCLRPSGVPPAASSWPQIAASREEELRALRWGQSQTPGQPKKLLDCFTELLYLSGCFMSAAGCPRLNSTGSGSHQTSVSLWWWSEDCHCLIWVSFNLTALNAFLISLRFLIILCFKHVEIRG